LGLRFREENVMIKRTVFFCALVSLCLIPVSLAHGAVDALWARYWPGIQETNRHDDSIAAIVTDADGSVYVTGTGWSAASNSFDFVTASYDSTGRELWRSYYNGAQTGSVDGAIAIARGNDGGIYVTGTSQESGRRNYTTTVKYNGVTGAQIWATPLGLPKDTSSNEGANGLAYDPANDIVYACGTSLNDPNDDDYVLIRYNSSNGAVAWTRYWDGGQAGGDDHCSGMCVQIGSQRPVLTGYYYNDASVTYDWATVFYDTSGTRRWVDRHSWSSDDDERPFGLCSDSAGKIYVTGVRAASTGIYFRLALQRLIYRPGVESSSTVTSNMGAGGSGDDEYWGIGCRVSGSRVYVIGSFYDAAVSGTSGEDWGIAAWDTVMGANASPAWLRYYDGGYNAFGMGHKASGTRHRALGIRHRKGARDQEPGAYDSESPTALTFDRQGQLYVAGYAIHGDGMQYWHIRRYNPGNPNQVATWDFRRDTVWDNRPFAIVATDTNRFYVSGYTTSFNHIAADTGFVSDQTLVRFGPGAKSVVLDSLRPMFPADTVDSGYAVARARAYYHNNGQQVAIPALYRYVTPSFKDSASGLPVASGQSDSVEFVRRFTLPLGTQILDCTLDMAGDTSPANNRVMDTVFVRARLEFDVSTEAITQPVGTVDSGTVIAPQASVRNNGTNAVNFKLKFAISDGYLDTTRVCTLAASSAKTVTFANWTVRGRGDFAMKCSTRLAGDQNPANDAALDTVFGRVLDVAVESIIAPVGMVDSGAAIAPQAALRNKGNTAVTFSARFDVGTWNNTQSVNLNPGAGQTVSFAAWTATQLGTFGTKCTTMLASDAVPGNNKLTGTVQVIRPPSHDVGTTRIVAPAGIIDSGVAIAPACSVYNYGNQNETYTVRMKIGAAYNNTVQVSSHTPGIRVYVTFPDYAASVPGTFAVSCSTELSNDSNRTNDRQTGSVTVAVHDVGATAILAPSGTVDSGTAVTPRAIVRNRGTSAESFLVRFSIGSFYSDDTLVSLAQGGVDTVAFVNWTAGPVGVHITRCSTMLAGDMNPGNNRVTDSVRVIPLSGIADPGPASVLPGTFALEGNRPNPFLGQTEIRYALPRDCRVRLDVFGPTGRLIRTLKSGTERAGYRAANWDRCDANGRPVAGGVYFCRLIADEFSAMRKMILE
jgi:hypothetical protein